MRGDSAYGREEIMSWCEAQPNLEYVLAYASNERLQSFTWGLEQRDIVADRATASTDDIHP